MSRKKRCGVLRPSPQSVFVTKAGEKKNLEITEKSPCFCQNKGFFMDKYSVAPSAGNFPGEIFRDTDSPPICVKFAERRTA